MAGVPRPDAGMLHDKRLAAVFWLPAQERPRDLAALLAQTGATDIGSPELGDVSGLVRCTWAGLACLAGTAPTGDFQVLQVRPWQSDVLDAVTGGGDALAAAFGAACEALRPEVAWFATHLDQAQPEAIVALEWAVASRDVTTLAGQHFGALYLDHALANPLAMRPDGHDRDRLPLRTGVMIFADHGPDRWL